MGLGLAFKAFFKALKDPEWTQGLLAETPKKGEAQDPSHLRLLSMLQNDGRLIDFFKEDIAGYTDAQVGAAVRKIHHDCGKSLEEIVTIRPLLEENEGAKVHVPKGYDPARFKVVGKIKGEPPYEGIIMHKGWKAHKRSLPRKVGEQQSEVICPAEIEVKF